jgi:hypothetical protein
MKNPHPGEIAAEAVKVRRAIGEGSAREESRLSAPTEQVTTPRRRPAAKKAAK